MALSCSLVLDTLHVDTVSMDRPSAKGAAMYMLSTRLQRAECSSKLFHLSDQCHKWHKRHNRQCK